MSGRGVRDAGYDDFLDAVADGEGYYLRCPEGHGSLPPRRVCPHCGGSLAEEPLPEAGTVVARTTIRVPTPSFAEDDPFVTAIADFGDVRLTGVVRGVEPDAVERGTTVGATVGATRTDGSRLLVFEPR